MSVYSKGGTATDTAYNISGDVLLSAFDLEKNDLLSGLEDIVPGRLLVWHDEFDGSVVDSQKWKHLYGYYTDYRYYMYQNNLSHNAFCQDGNLHYNNIKDSDMPLSDWTGAFIWTKDIFEFRYGLIEAKMKFPDNPVYHSTFWTMGAGYERICTPDAIADASKGLLWATCGEIDIAEADNGVVSTTKHWADNIETNHHVSGGHEILTNDASNWHIYGCEWTGDYIKVYCDRVLKGTFPISDADVGGFNAFRRPHFLIFNQLPQLNGMQEKTELETQVAWVRVYAPEGVTEIIPDTALVLDSASLSMSVGDAHLLTGLFAPSNPTDMTLTWNSSNPSVAMVYGGKVTALASGSTIISATTKNGHTAMCTVSVV